MQNTQQQQSNGENSEKPHLPTVLGLKVRSTEELQEQCSQNTNSLLKQQLRAGLKEIKKDSLITSNSVNNSKANTMQQQISLELTNNDACSALQSLANAAERQVPNALQAMSSSASSSFQQQLLLNSLMANNVMINASTEFYQQQLQQQQQQQQMRDDDYSPPNLNIILDEPDKSEPEVSLADESLGLNYEKSPSRRRESPTATPQAQDTKKTKERKNDANKPVKVRASSSRVVQRRRVRRKAQSSFDDQAEHLTEMSVRGLDLFRYASINDGVYQCIECLKENVEKTFKNKYSFQRHAFLYHEGKHRKVFPCTICGKEFSRPDKMKNHMKMIHEGANAQQAQVKDTNNFNPLNYLINAAAAGELFAQQHLQEHQQFQQQQQQVQIQVNKKTPRKDSTLSNEQQSQNPSVEQMVLENALLKTLNVKHFNDPSRSCEISLVTPKTSPANDDASEFINNTDNNDILVKEEINISPSPSPPPLPLPLQLALPSTSILKASSTQSQRLEEVK